MSEYQTIRWRPIHPDAIDKVTRRTAFGDDVTLAGALIHVGVHASVVWGDWV